MHNRLKANLLPLVSKFVEFMAMVMAGCRSVKQQGGDIEGQVNRLAHGKPICMFYYFHPDPKHVDLS